MRAKIILADDHQLVRQGLRALLESELGMDVIAEAADGETVVQLAREHMPDIIIMGVAMPDLDGIAATRRITNEFPSIKVIALSMYSSKVFVMDMFEAGASGYLSKKCASTELEEAIKAVLSDEMYISPKVAGVVLDSCTRRPIMAQKSTAVLTNRECEVLRLLANGKSTKEIAHMLKKSIQTIDMHRRQIMRKLGIQSVAELTKYAIREGLTTIDF